MRTPSFLLIIATLGLPACEQVTQALGLEEAAKKEARLEAEGRAVGGGCRQSGRAIEDCYSIYSWLPKAAVFAGWRDMDAYMRENKIDTVVPQLPPAQPPGAKKRKKADEEADAHDSKAEAKAAEKSESPAKDEKGGDKAADKSGDKSSGKGTEKPAEKSSGKSADKPAEKAPAESKKEAEKH